MPALIHAYPVYSASLPFTSSYTGSDESIVYDEYIGLITASLIDPFSVQYQAIITGLPPGEIYDSYQLPSTHHQYITTDDYLYGTSDQYLLSQTLYKLDLQRMSSDNIEYMTSRQTEAIIYTEKLQRSVFVNKSSIKLGDDILYMFRGEDSIGNKVYWNSYDFNYRPSNVVAQTKQSIGEYVSLAKNGQSLGSYGNMRSGSLDPYTDYYTSSLEVPEFGNIYFQYSNVASNTNIIEEWQQRAEDLNATDKIYWRSANQITTSPQNGYVKNNTVENVETIYRK
jgi:hypothetical protein